MPFTLGVFAFIIWSYGYNMGGTSLLVSYKEKRTIWENL